METSGDAAVLTHPPGVSRRDLATFLARHSGWLAEAAASHPGPVPVTDGCTLPVDGAERLIRRMAGLRSPALEGETLAVPMGAEVGPGLADWLKARARSRLSALADSYAGKLGRRHTGIGVRDTRSRWGSCSSRGRLSFSWRLAMAPQEVQAYVAAHEVAHLAEMNHSARYWAALAGLMPDYEAPRAWLKDNGRLLHRYRFGTER
jgi:hypothetical protein